MVPPLHLLENILTISHLIQLANESGGTLYIMLALLLVALTVIVERMRYLSNMQHRGEQLIAHLRARRDAGTVELNAQQQRLPHAKLIESMRNEPPTVTKDALDGHLEEVIMHEVPTLDRALWVLDTVITLAPLVGLFGTIIGMFNAFHVLGDAQNAAAEVTGGIAEALIATASGLFIAIVGLVFFNALHNRVRLIVHQMETIKVMLLNRHERLCRVESSGLSSVERLRA